MLCVDINTLQKDVKLFTLKIVTPSAIYSRSSLQNYKNVLVLTYIFYIYSLVLGTTGELNTYG